MIYDKEAFDNRLDFYNRIKDRLKELYGEEYIKWDMCVRDAPLFTYNVLGDIPDDYFEAVGLEIHHNHIWVEGKFKKTDEVFSIDNYCMNNHSRIMKDGPSYISTNGDFNFTSRCNPSDYGISYTIREINNFYGLDLPLNYWDWTEKDFMEFKLCV